MKTLGFKKLHHTKTKTNVRSQTLRKVKMSANVYQLRYMYLEKNVSIIRWLCFW
jgi:hypothetical protein